MYRFAILLLIEKKNSYLTLSYPLNNIFLLIRKHFSVVACQRYLCPNEIPMTI